MGVYALFNFINEINLIGQHNYTTLSAIIYVAADLPAVIYSHFCFNALALNDSAYCSVNGAINSPNKITIKINIYL
jgi:hypothetical protein